MWVQAVTDSDDTSMVTDSLFRLPESIIVGLSLLEAMVLTDALEGIPNATGALLHLKMQMAIEALGI